MVFGYLHNLECRPHAYTFIIQNIQNYDNYAHRLMYGVMMRDAVQLPVDLLVSFDSRSGRPRFKGGAEKAVGGATMVGFVPLPPEPESTS